MSVLPCALDLSTQYVGPPEDFKGGRKQYLLEANETFSTADRIHGTVVVARTVEETAQLKTPALLIAKYEPMIVDHVERRVVIFFHQLVVAYKTALHFEIGETRDQGKSATALMLTDHEKVQSKLCVRHAAHSSTLPCIIAYDGKKWADYIANQSPKPEGFVYIQGSDIYRGANSTMAMPCDINKADIEIDGKNKEVELRHYALKLLNESAMGVIDPINGLKQFVQEIYRITSIKAGSKPGVQATLAIYNKNVNTIQLELNQNNKIFSYLLGVHSDIDPVVQHKLYELRYKAIQECQFAQSAMIQKIKKVIKEILPVGTSSRFEETFRVVLREQLTCEEDRVRLDKLFNNSQNGERLQGLKGFASTKEKIEKQLPKIKILASGLHDDFQKLKDAEGLKRGEVLYVIRGVKGWTQRQLAAIFKFKFPGARAGQSNICRMENKKKRVTDPFMQQLIIVMEVDKVFFKQLCYYD